MWVSVFNSKISYKCLLRIYLIINCLLCNPEKNIIYLVNWNKSMKMFYEVCKITIILKYAECLPPSLLDACMWIVLLDACMWNGN